MQKEQWQVTCECGFRTWHTVAKVPLSDEILEEVFSTGKTKNKIDGFVSKAGNAFSSCLKFENDTIAFDFSNPGEQEKVEEKSFIEEVLQEEQSMSKEEMDGIEEKKE